MLANQEYVKRINKAAGVENIVHVETYFIQPPANRMRSCSPQIEQNTRRKKFLSLPTSCAPK
ncbi:hypothetical protein ACJMK2_014372 [Sinanodonta woodiana]|uniref:Uncharacterized protein n=1 Tax=Sinanodonta woodiana TaxID=1069815 RepID=A0ABD3V0W7_SINWO